MNKKYIASVSFGKDSLAMLYVIKEKGLPLDEILYVNIMATHQYAQYLVARTNERSKGKCRLKLITASEKGICKNEEIKRQESLTSNKPLKTF